jgi:cytochrome c oxidase subunit 4
MSTNGHSIATVRTLVSVFLALMVLTAVTTGIAFVNLGAGSTVVALLIAGCKAALVVWFFMNVRFNTRLTPILIVAAILFLGILFSLTFVDYFSRGWYGVPGK